MTHRTILAFVLAVSATIPLCGCASSSDSSSSPATRTQTVAQDASEQIALMQAEDARRLGEALALGEKGDRAFTQAVSLENRGETDEANARYTEAVVFYSQAVSTYDEFFALWNNLGTSLAALDRYQQAQEAYIRASNINPADPRPWYNRGLLYRERGYPREARRHFEQALEQDPRFVDAMWGIIKADITTGEESRQTLDHIRTALFLVTDPDHRQYLELERERIRSKLGLSEASSSENTGSSQD
jgi:tetratricopeptide (TPR) repeat protein